MAIYFSCTQCGKQLFAQDQFAGQLVICPQCKANNRIPTPVNPEAAVPLEMPEAAPSDPTLIDMEKGPEPESKAVETLAQNQVPPATSSSEISAATSNPASAPSAPSESSPASSEPTKRCPYCAERILAAAVKCRFCGSIVDEQIQQEQLSGAKLMLANAERTANIWRALSMMTTWFTIGWLALLTTHIWESNGPILLLIFDLLLLIGLIWSTRQMRAGPYNVFLAAALTIMLCMPLNVLLGLPLNMEGLTQEQLMKQYNMQNMSPDAFWQMMRVSAAIGFFVVGCFFAIPLWVATMKVAAADKLRESLRAKP